ncbi:MAG: hypothetical protein ACI81L_001367 [Verrucomicrobiales bacterium]
MLITSNRFDGDMTTAASRNTNTSQDTSEKPERFSPATELKFASIATIGFGLLIALGSHTLTDGPMRYFADLLFWPLGDAPIFADEAQLLAAILGGVMTSWGVLFWLLTDSLAQDHPALLKRLILTTMATWFVIDSTGSIASGGWLNVIGNLGFLALFVLPARKL